VTGPLAKDALFDFYSGVTPHAIGVLQGIKDKAGPGVSVNYAATNTENAAVNAARASDIAVVVVGNDPMCGAKTPWQAFNRDASTKPCPEPGDGREGRDRESIDLPIKDRYTANSVSVSLTLTAAVNGWDPMVPGTFTI